MHKSESKNGTACAEVEGNTKIVEVGSGREYGPDEAKDMTLPMVCSEKYLENNFESINEIADMANSEEDDVDSDEGELENEVSSEERNVDEAAEGDPGFAEFPNSEPEPPSQGCAIKVFDSMHQLGEEETIRPFSVHEIKGSDESNEEDQQVFEKEKPVDNKREENYRASEALPLKAADQNRIGGNGNFSDGTCRLLHRTQASAAAPMLRSWANQLVLPVLNQRPMP
ncbi:hypothetical protein U1Q18_049184, partial [Sarracenia purpurea var. burkii]